MSQAPALNYFDVWFACVCVENKPLSTTTNKTKVSKAADWFGFPTFVVCLNNGHVVGTCSEGNECQNRISYVDDISRTDINYGFEFQHGTERVR
jgi:hypothetical protein